MTVSLLIARSLVHAIVSATVDWKWQVVEGLRTEFTRPDNYRETIRFLPDGQLSNLAWGTKVYLGSEWTRRNDYDTLRGLLVQGFFIEGDPQLPPPRPRKRDAMSELKSSLKRLQEQGYEI